MVQPESPNLLRKAAEPKTCRDSSATSVDDENNFSSRFFMNSLSFRNFVSFVI